MTGDLVEAGDRWQMPLEGLIVSQCRLDYAITFVLAGEGGSYYAAIEGPFSVRTAGVGDEVVVDPEGSPAEMAPALSVLRQTVEQAVAFKDGRLELAFTDGTVLRVAVSDDYESWNIVGPDGLRIVSLPGGELAIWNPDGDGR